MAKETMTIHKGLVELKLIDSKINKAIKVIMPVALKQKDKLIDGHIEEKEFNKNATERYQSIVDLIAKKSKIKDAIVKANGKTKVKVAGVEMYIADAINKKKEIEYKRALLEDVAGKHNAVVADLNRKNEDVTANCLEVLLKALGKDNVKTEGKEVEAIRKPFMEANEYMLIDPLKIMDKCEALEKEINDFEADVDATLSEINAVTKISIG